MGSEVTCTVRVGSQTSEGIALLETDALIFRGAFGLSIPLKDVKSVEAKHGQLRVEFSAGEATFDLGPLASQWALKIRYPRSLMDKLGVKPDSRVSVLGLQDPAFHAQLEQRTADISNRLRQESDFIFYAADRLDQLKQLARLKDGLKSNGAIWVVSLKGKQARIKDVDVIAAAIAAGLVDTKVVSFSDTHTALKLVIPVAKR